MLHYSRMNYGIRFDASIEGVTQLRHTVDHKLMHIFFRMSAGGVLVLPVPLVNTSR